MNKVKKDSFKKLNIYCYLKNLHKYGLSDDFK